MPSTVSPNMSLIIPSVGTQAGPQYATDVNNSLSIIDAHDHTSGNGVQVPTAGINIDATLSANDNAIGDLLALSMSPQGSPLSGVSYPASLYVSGVDLYYNDDNGNQIQLTNAGAIAGTPGSIAGLSAPAAASYLSGSLKFLWEANSGTSLAANMEMASIIIREQVAGGNGITVSAPAGLSAAYTLTLAAALPGTDNALTLTTPSGNQSYLDKGAANEVLRVDGTGTSLEYSTIDTANITNGAVTQAKRAALGQQVSSSSGSSYTNNTAVLTDVTNLTVTITTTGRPVFVGMMGDGSVSTGGIQLLSNGGIVTGKLALLRDGTKITEVQLNQTFGSSGDPSVSLRYPNSVLYYIDVPSAGTYTYKVQAAGGVSINTTTIRVDQATLIAYEL